MISAYCFVVDFAYSFNSGLSGDEYNLPALASEGFPLYTYGSINPIVWSILTPPGLSLNIDSYFSAINFPPIPKEPSLLKIVFGSIIAKPQACQIGRASCRER